MSACSVDFWTGAWREAQACSAIRRSQRTRPDSWATFYEQVSDAWLSLQGEPWRLGTEVANALAAHRILSPGIRVLDLGCGPGTLAIPLAKHGARVTAIDASPGMTARLATQLTEQKVVGVDVRTVDWDALTAADRRDVGLAACFPPVLSPAGIERLESLSQSTCVIVIGAGSEPFPFRRRIWQRLMRDPMPEAQEQLICLLGFLLATERKPNLVHIEWPARLDMDADRACTFYRRYFEMLVTERPVDDIDAVVDAVLNPFLRHGRCQAEGIARVALIWWSVVGHGQ